MKWLLGIFKFLVGLWIKAPSPEAVIAKDDGAKTEIVAAETKELNDVQKAQTASAVVSRTAASNPSSLRDPAPDSRD